MLTNIMWVAAGGMIGALSRWGLVSGIKYIFPIAFPLPTLIVNILGCFCIGYWMGTMDQQSIGVNLFVMVGLLGAFTTFSTFGLDCFALIQAKKWSSLLIYWGLSNGLGMLMLVLGLWISD